MVVEQSINNQWYCVVAEFGHGGTGRSLSKTLYVRAKGPLEAFDALNNIGGFKHNARFPDIVPIGESEMIATLAQIASSGNLHPSLRTKGYDLLFDDELGDYSK